MSSQQSRSASTALAGVAGDRDAWRAPRFETQLGATDASGGVAEVGRGAADAVGWPPAPTAGRCARVEVEDDDGSADSTGSDERS